MQSILRTGCLLIGVFGLSPVHAQSLDTTSRPKTAPVAAQAGVNAVPAGPVLRKQPRAADVPTTSDASPNSPLHETPDDEAMNRLIRGICRGC